MAGGSPPPPPPRLASADALRARLKDAPWLLPVLPAAFQPKPSDAMLAAHTALLRRAAEAARAAER
jgi:hypothetical protein